MARLESASRLRWPRRIMVSIVSLRNRLAAAASSSSPARSRYSQAIWKDSSSSWESETLMSGKRIRAACVPRHMRLAMRFCFNRHRNLFTGSTPETGLPVEGASWGRRICDRSAFALQAGPSYRGSSKLGLPAAPICKSANRNSNLVMILGSVIAEKTLALRIERSMFYVSG
jgi:hypothetical protein